MKYQIKETPAMTTQKKNSNVGIDDQSNRTDPSNSSSQSAFRDQPSKGGDQPGLILHYRTLKTNLFFTLIWLLMVFLAFILIGVNHIQSDSIEYFTLILSGGICLILAIHSIDTYGGPFIYFNKTNLMIRHSMIRKVVIDYNMIESILVVNEEVEITRKSGPPVMLNLAQLSFTDQAICLKHLNEILPSTGQPAQIVQPVPHPKL